MTFEKGGQSIPGVENKRQISYFCRKHTQNMRLKDNGKGKREVRL